MSYNMMFQRPFNDHEKPFVYVETDITGNIVPESLDRSLNYRVTFNTLEVKCRKKGDSKYTLYILLRDDKLDLFITDSRVIIKKQSMKDNLRFDGSLTNLAIDGIFKAVHDRKVQGQNLLGHIRYEWLKEVMYYQKKGWTEYDMIRLTYYDTDDALWMVTLSFSSSTDVKSLANEILHRACRYKDRMTDEKQEKLKDFIRKYWRADIPVASAPKQFSCVAFPIVYCAPGGAKFRPETEKEQAERAGSKSVLLKAPEESLEKAAPKAPDAHPEDPEQNDSGTDELSRLQALRDLKGLFDDGIITQEEFSRMKKKYLGISEDTIPEGTKQGETKPETESPAVPEKEPSAADNKTDALKGRICRNCGRINSMTARFCAGCGTRIE